MKTLKTINESIENNKFVKKVLALELNTKH